MKLELKGHECLCYLSSFKINDVPAYYSDFGDKYDHDKENAPEYGCGNMQFESIPPTQNILDKYHITMDEYYIICEKLDEALSFGCCAYCS
jgi:hypothetical protein